MALIDLCALYPGIISGIIELDLGACRHRSACQYIVLFRIPVFFIDRLSIDAGHFQDVQTDPDADAGNSTSEEGKRREKGFMNIL